jgi:hypothetical protein
MLGVCWLDIVGFGRMDPIGAANRMEGRCVIVVDERKKWMKGLTRMDGWMDKWISGLGE